MKHFKILVWFYSPQVKWCMKFSTKQIVYKLPHEFLNDLTLRILGHLRKLGHYGKSTKMGGGRA